MQRSETAAKASGEWHLIVVCGDSGWKEYSAFSSVGQAQLAEAGADIDVSTKTIFLRGTRLQNAGAVELALSHSLESITPDAVQIARR